MGFDAFPEVDWDEVPLSELTSANVTYGVVQPGSPVSDGVPMIRVKNFDSHTLNLSEVIRISHDVEQKYGRTRVRAGDVLITVVGSVGQVAIVPPELTGWNIARAVALIRPKSPDLARWIAYFLRSPVAQHRMGIAANTTVQTTVNLKDLRAMAVPMPPASVRRGITELLSALDDRIDNLRQTNTTLEAIAQALFKSWFVDFDPVHAKAEGRAPEAMDATAAALFPSEFEQSELGLIPKGWRVGHVKDLGAVVCGKTPSTSNPENFGDDIPFITIPDLHNRLVVTTTARSLSLLGANSQVKKFLPPGAICVSCIATPGLVARVVTPSQTNQQINSVVPLDIWGKSFPLFLLRRIGDSVRRGGSGGSVFHNLNKSGFEALAVVLATSDLALRFGETVEPIIEKILTNQEQIGVLAQLRDTLLPRLISSKLCLSEAIEASEEAPA